MPTGSLPEIFEIVGDTQGRVLCSYRNKIETTRDPVAGKLRQTKIAYPQLSIPPSMLPPSARPR